MVKEGWINLIEEFTNLQKENDVILLTTFNFDPTFFDIFLLDKLLQKNPVGDIFILMDGDEYNRIYPFFTHHTGRGYYLIPVFCNKGVFHPKVFMFFSENNAKITAFIGSPNITLSGFTSNAEIVTKIISSINPVYSSIKEVFSFFEKLVSNSYVRNKNFIQTVDHLKNKIGNNVDDKNLTVFHNIDKPILPRVMEMVNKPKDVFLLAPFWSENTKVLETLIQSGTIKNIEIALQKNNHNLKKPEIYKSFIEKNNVSFSFNNANFADNRRFHSKIIGFKGDENYLFVGSSNLTEYALLNTCENGNFEVSILLTMNPKTIINEIKINPISDIEDISKTSAIFERGEKTHCVVVYNVDFDLIKSVLIIEMKKSIEKTKIQILFEDGTSTSFEVCNQENIETYCEKIPFEVTFEQIGIITKRRVFYDSNYFYKRIKRGSINLDEIGKKVLSDCNINAGDLLRVVYGLNSSILEEKPSSGRSISDEKKGTEKKFYGPSKDFIDGNKHFINRLLEVYKYLTSMKYIQKERQESSEIEDKDVREPQYLKKIYNDAEERQKLCMNLIKSINNILIYKILKGGNKPNEKISAMSLFAQSIVKIMTPIYIDRNLMDDFAEKVDNNLKGIARDGLDFETRKYFFMNLVLTNYTVEFPQRYFCVDHLFRTDEILNPNFFEECKIYIKNQIKNIDISKQINFNEIGFYAGRIASYIPNGSNVLDDLKNTIQQANNFENEEELQFLKAFLENLKRWSISPVVDELKDIANGLNEKQKRLILSIISSYQIPCFNTDSQ